MDRSAITDYVSNFPAIRILGPSVLQDAIETEMVSLKRTSRSKWTSDIEGRLLFRMGDPIDHVYLLGMGAIVCYYPKITMEECNRASEASTQLQSVLNSAKAFNQLQPGRLLTTKQLHEHAILADVRRDRKWAGLNDLLCGSTYKTSGYVGGSVAYLKVTVKQANEWIKNRRFSDAVKKEFEREFWQTQRELALRTYGDNEYQVFRLCEYLDAHVKSRAHAARMGHGSPETVKEVKIVGNYMRIAFHLGTLDSQIRDVIQRRFLKGPNPILTKTAIFQDHEEGETSVALPGTGNTLDRMTYWIQTEALKSQLAEFRRFNAVLRR